MERWITVKGRHILIDDSISLERGIKQHYPKKCKISYKEKEKIRHILNTECNIYQHNSKYKIGGIYQKPIGNYKYTFEIIDFDEYNIVGKQLIEDRKDGRKTRIPRK